MNIDVIATAIVNWVTTNFEPIFSKNTAFNKNFGTMAGTVCDGQFMSLKNQLMTGYFTIYNTYVAGTRYFIQYAAGTPINSTSGNAMSQMPTTYSLLSTNHPTINGVVPKFRLKVTIGVNNTAPACNLTIDLRPITTPVSSGGATVKSWTIGSAVTGSAVVQNTPSANTQYELVSGTFYTPC
jgi:hypothetical protein